MTFLLELLQNPWIASLAIVLGFVCLIFGADWLVDGASAIARRFGISPLVIGLTIVAFGTSMPEFIVSILAAVQGNTEIAITNILGSNTINVCVILGLSAIIYPLASQRQSRRFDIPWSVLAGLLVLFFATYTKPSMLSWGEWGMFTSSGGFISGIGGVVLLICFVVFLWHSVRVAKSTPEQAEDEAPVKSITLSRAILLVLLGLVGLVVGGEMIVRSATSIAHQLGVSDAIIGLTIVALGTSLPELATSCVAAAKHNSDLAIGNVIGSNIFNIFFILGTSAVIHPLPTYDGLWLDALLVTISCLLVMLFVGFTKKHEIKRWHGVLLLLVYGAYLTYRLMNM